MKSSAEMLEATSAEMAVLVLLLLLWLLVGQNTRSASSHGLPFNSPPPCPCHANPWIPVLHVDKT